MTDHNHNQNRRSFLKHAALATGAVGLNILVPRTSRAVSPIWGGPIPGFGDLIPLASQNTGEVLLELPEGFKYTVLGRTGQVMSDGNPTPSNADGMGAFQFGDKIRVVCNHERGPGFPLGNPALAYDPAASGGTTTLTVDPVTRLTVERFVSSSGTIRNCAGGVTPWGTWLTCEETNLYSGSTQKQHGYTFEVPAFATGQVAVTPLAGLGLLYPEAAVIDPKTGIVYITMDRNPSGLFRFIPQEYGVLSGPGRLQMLAIEGDGGFNTSLESPLHVRLPVKWVDLTSPTPEGAYRADSLVVFKEGFAQGGASFSRLEGAWYSRDSVLFAATSGGVAGFGQVFELHLLNNDRQELELIFESTDREQLDAPDNICVSPTGDNLVLCEDGSGSEYLHLLRRRGNQIYRLAKNIIPGQEGSEWAGACFSPDGKTLFANVQGAGVTFAIWTENWGSIR